ncbi:MAG: ATP-binding protein [Cyanophyceae cyanobacterium]
MAPPPPFSPSSGPKNPTEAMDKPQEISTGQSDFSHGDAGDSSNDPLRGRFEAGESVREHHRPSETAVSPMHKGKAGSDQGLYMGTTALASFGAELAFVQDASGQYWDFYWREAEHHGLSALDLCGCALGDCTFTPVAIAEYLDQLQQVLKHGVPKRFDCVIQFQSRSQEKPSDNLSQNLNPLDGVQVKSDGSFIRAQAFELVMSPVLTAESHARQVMVMGRSVQMDTEAAGQVAMLQRTDRPVLSQPGLEAHQRLLSRIARSIRRTLPLSSALYQILLTKISRQIRRTLDLKNIWQQTVEGLGQALSVSRCVVWSPQVEGDRGIEGGDVVIEVTAEYVGDDFVSMRGETAMVADRQGFIQAMESGDPVAIAQAPNDKYGNQSLVVVATRYREVVNGFITLYQCDRVRQWTGAELELLRELSDQVGTAIAHAKLFTESQTLTNELREKNLSLLKKQQELEDARQQAEEVSRLKSEFLANTSHEIRTPLNGILCSLQLVLDGMVDDPKEAEEFLTTANESAMHLLNILNDILDVAKIEADRLEVGREPVKLLALLTTTKNLIQAQIQEKGLYFEVEVPETHDEILLYGDYQRLLQVILNLTGNAIKFTDEGGVTVSVDLITSSGTDEDEDEEDPLGEPDAGMALFRIIDTGIGVALDDQDKLFQAFSQADGRRTRKFGGTGLGLVLSQQLVQAMGGEMNFYSLGEGLGSTVTFSMPLYQEPLVAATEDLTPLDSE